MSNDSLIAYMLDTNIVSHFLRGNQAVIDKVLSISMNTLCISAITEAELYYGLAKNPTARRLQELVHEFLIRVDIIPWDSTAAITYGKLRAKMQVQGLSLGNLDMLIAAHALALDIVLVTNDKAFSFIKALHCQDWTVL